jgi:hypothetical protein
MLTKILRGLYSLCSNISCFSVPYYPAHGSIAEETFAKTPFYCVTDNSCFKPEVKRYTEEVELRISNFNE